MNENEESSNLSSLPFRKIMVDAWRQHHPLAQSVDETQLRPLVQALRTRFAQADVLLDDWNPTVWGLREAGAEYAKEVARRGKQFTDEDHLRIIREFVGRLGWNYLIAMGGTWLQGSCLLEASVGEERRLVVRRGAEQKTVTRMTTSIGYLATDVWHAAFTGSDEPVDLYITTYVEYPDGHGEWEKPRVRLILPGSGEKASPSAWKVEGF
jgi:hypothetical protein